MMGLITDSQLVEQNKELVDDVLKQVVWMLDTMGEDRASRAVVTFRAEFPAALDRRLEERS